MKCALIHGTLYASVNILHPKAPFIVPCGNNNSFPETVLNILRHKYFALALYNVWDMYQRESIHSDVMSGRSSKGCETNFADG